MKIAIVRLSALGDIVHSLIVLEFIKKHIPYANITWVVDSSFKELIKYNPLIDNIIDLELKELKKDFNLQKIKNIKSKLKKEFDIVFDLQGLIKSALVSKFLSKNVVGREYGCVKESLAASFYTTRFIVPCEKNVVDRNLMLFSKYFGFNYTKDEILNKKELLYYKKEDFTKINSLLKEKNILFVPSSSVKNKNYPPKKYQNIINSLNHNCLILWGNEKEKEIANLIASKTKAKVLPKLSLNELKYLISKVDLVVGSDTGPVHMAWGMNRKSIVIFGYTTKNLMFETPKNIAISAKDVDLCRWNKKDDCIKNIKEDKIVKEIKRLMEQK